MDTFRSRRYRHLTSTIEQHQLLIDLDVAGLDTQFIMQHSGDSVFVTSEWCEESPRIVVPSCETAENMTQSTYPGNGLYILDIVLFSCSVIFWLDCYHTMYQNCILLSAKSVTISHGVQSSSSLCR